MNRKREKRKAELASVEGEQYGPPRRVCELPRISCAGREGLVHGTREHKATLLGTKSNGGLI